MKKVRLEEREMADYNKKSRTYGTSDLSDLSDLSESQICQRVRSVRPICEAVGV